MQAQDFELIRIGSGRAAFTSIQARTHASQYSFFAKFGGSVFVVVAVAVVVTLRLN
jgi:hypothetical protein